MWGLVFFVCTFLPIFNCKEYVPASGLTDKETDLIQKIIKRLGTKEESSPLRRADDHHDDADSQLCGLPGSFTRYKGKIIKSVDSIDNGAKYLTEFPGVDSLLKCTEYCCKNSSCDTAVFENKGERKCFLFRCQGNCSFSEHPDYSYSQIGHRFIQTPLPDAATKGVAEPDYDHNYDDAEGKSGSGSQGNGVDSSENSKPAVSEEGTTATPAHTTASAITAAAGIMAPLSDESVEDEGPGNDTKDDNSMDSEPKIPEEQGQPDSEHGPEDDEDQVTSEHDSQNPEGSQETQQEEKQPTTEEVEKEEKEPSATEKEEENKPGSTEDSEEEKEPDSTENEQKSNHSSSEKDGKTSSSAEPQKEETDSSEEEEKLSEVSSADKTTTTTTITTTQGQFISREKVETVVEVNDLQVPIIALSVGLAFTFILLVFVACRLCRVHRQLRKGRPLHSNEADYLINGMYL